MALQDDKIIFICDDSDFAINDDNIPLPPGGVCIKWDSINFFMDSTDITLDNHCTL